jgi:uncharacterized protein YijF (DUF1287 family)
MEVLDSVRAQIGLRYPNDAAYDDLATPAGDTGDSQR